MIEDFYITQGFSGESLRKKLLKDEGYQKLLMERKQKLGKRASLTKAEEKKYVMSVDEDYAILEKIKILEKMKLGKEEKFLVHLIKAQLEHDWRKSLIKVLDKLLSKHR